MSCVNEGRSVRAGINLLGGGKFLKGGALWLSVVLDPVAGSAKHLQLFGEDFSGPFGNRTSRFSWLPPF